MLGLYEMKTGDEDSARRHFERVSDDPWRGPATVFAAGLGSASGDHSAALRILIEGAAGLDAFWADQAREVVAGLPPELVATWRRLETEALADPVEKTRRRAMARSLTLEIDDGALAAFRSRAWTEVGLEPVSATPSFPPGLAARLWSLGLKASALRWDPSGLPRETPSSTWWTAETELELGRPWLAISAADGARWQASSFLPPRGLPLGLRRSLYPLPYELMVRDAAGRHGLDWTLLAGVAREESRWKPTVVSKVGARGLMQLMPATAVATAKANGRPEIHPDDLFEPMISLDLGAAELGRLVAVFKGNRAAAVSAYNAGEAQARLWLDQCGAGCTEARFLAQISFSVTRGYTEAVLASARVYEELYGKPISERSE
jgi:soluble lytic murein transglycosylase-like protein